MSCRNALVAASFLSALSLPASAMLIFNELSTGDLSSNPLLPTQLSVDVGSNFIDASVDAKDRDYFTLKLPAGAYLSAIILRASSGSDATFLSFQSGSIFTEPAGTTDLRNLLGYASFFHSDVGTDLLQTLGSASEAIGFDGAPDGEMFTFWIDQSNPSPANYQLEFVIAEVPAPATALLLAAAVAIPSRRPRRA